MRLFIAIDLPVGHKRKLGKLCSEIPGARLVPAEQIHLTLAFLGDVDADAAGLLTGELAKIEIGAFKLSFDGVGCFPNRHHPRVLWVGLRQNPHLTRLAASIFAVVRGCGIPLEERPFYPHITLARLNLTCSHEVSLFLNHHSKIAVAPFTVREFTLLQSQLSQYGAEHLPLRNFPLATIE